PAGQSLQGLCGNSSRSLSKERLSEDSSTSCNLLKEAPFSSCDIDPEPYISACIDTLCSYSDLDHLRCQFLEAYARACSLKSKTTLEDWRSKADCCKTCFLHLLVGCLLEDKGIDYSVLQLKEPTCRGQIDKQTHMVTFSFNSANLCGTEITNNNSQVIYKNTIMSQNLSSGGITHQDQVYIDFSCIQTPPDIQTVVFRMKSRCV
ncbi:hypothetical protein GOODEAATRI_032974, partial [Goodea atripinnis]